MSFNSFWVLVTVPECEISGFSVNYPSGGKLFWSSMITKYREKSNKTKPIKIHKSCCFAATIRTGEKNHQRGGLVKVVHCWSQSSHHWGTFVPRYSPQVVRFPDTYLRMGFSLPSSLHLYEFPPIASGSQDKDEKLLKVTLNTNNTNRNPTWQN